MCKSVEKQSQISRKAVANQSKAGVCLRGDQLAAVLAHLNILLKVLEQRDLFIKIDTN